VHVGIGTGMANTRYCFLVVEVEPAQGLSTRKLLIETAKHNVITAYSGKEGLETFDRFPNVNAVVVDSQLKDMDCSELTAKIKKRSPKIPVIALHHREELPKHVCNSNYVVPVHDPSALLKVLEEINFESAA
jgi:CheY-like chemotaxis protein